MPKIEEIIVRESVPPISLGEASVVIPQGEEMVRLIDEQL
jgi:hypothetical protein